MSDDLQEVAENAYQNARELRAKEEHYTGRKRGQVRKLRKVCEDYSRLTQDLIDLKKRIRRLEKKHDIRHRTRASRNGHGRP